MNGQQHEYGVEALLLPGEVPLKLLPTDQRWDPSQPSCLPWERDLPQPGPCLPWERTKRPEAASGPPFSQPHGLAKRARGAGRQTREEAEIHVEHGIAEDGKSFLWKTGAHRTTGYAICALLWGVLGALVFASAGAAGASAIVPCSFIERPGAILSDDMGCENKHPMVMALRCIDIAKLGLAYVVAVALLLVRRGAQLRCLLKNLPAGSRNIEEDLLSHQCSSTASSGDDWATNWTLTAGRDVFLESCRAFRNHTLFLCSVFIPTAAVYAAHHVYIATVRNPSESENNVPDEFDNIAESVCGPGNGLCKFSLKLSDVLPIPNTLLVAMLFLIVYGLPPELWDKLVDRALKKTGNVQLRRVIKLPPLVMIFGVVNLALLVYLFAFIHSRRKRSVGLQIYFLGEVALSLVQVATAIWIMVPEFGSGVKVKPVSTWDVRAAPNGGIFAWIPGWTHANILPWMEFLSSSEAGKRHLRRMYLFIAIVLFAMPSELVSSMYQRVVTWVLRATFLLILLGAHDAKATFSSLCSRRESGFGLVVDAKHLRKALEAHLDGNLYNSTIGTYKASIFRMQETLAVSYRWQPSSVTLAEQAPPINMSRWQMSTLASALRLSTAAYVWIDVMSVPQVKCGLQKTLLARMMAVYASAGAGTIALRSTQHHGERYHQRAWTTQEFCTSTKMSVYSETANCEDVQRVSIFNEMVPEMSATSAEEGMMMLQREKHLAEHRECKPYWLFRDDQMLFTRRDTITVMKRHIAQFQRLSRRTQCTVAADKYRALFPLVMNMPVENQEELAELIMRVYSAANLEPPVVQGLIDQRMLRMSHAEQTEREDIDTQTGRRYSLDIEVVAACEHPGSKSRFHNSLPDIHIPDTVDEEEEEEEEEPDGNRNQDAEHFMSDSKSYTVFNRSYDFVKIIPSAMSSEGHQESGNNEKQSTEPSSTNSSLAVVTIIP